MEVPEKSWDSVPQNLALEYKSSFIKCWGNNFKKSSEMNESRIILFRKYIWKA